MGARNVAYGSEESVSVGKPLIPNDDEGVNGVNAFIEAYKEWSEDAPTGVIVAAILFAALGRSAISVAIGRILRHMWVDETRRGL